MMTAGNESVQGGGAAQFVDSVATMAQVDGHASSMMDGEGQAKKKMIWGNGFGA